MFINQFTQLLKSNSNDNHSKIFLYPEEKEYVNKKENCSELINTYIVKDFILTRFKDAYMEIIDKESEKIIKIESADRFLQNSISYLKVHKKEFIYLESEWFQIIGVDSISIEVDDVFGTYDVMLGLKLPKKYEKLIRTYLTEHLNQKDEFDLMYNGQDGLWDLNFGLNFLNGFNEEITLDQAFQLSYRFLFNLVVEIHEFEK